MYCAAVGNVLDRTKCSGKARRKKWVEGEVVEIPSEVEVVVAVVIKEVEEREEEEEEAEMARVSAGQQVCATPANRVWNKPTEVNRSGAVHHSVA